MVTAQSIYNTKGASYLTRGTAVSEQYISRHKLQFLCDTSILHNCNHVFILFLHIYLHYKSNAICRVSSVPESV